MSTVNFIELWNELAKVIYLFTVSRFSTDIISMSSMKCNQLKVFRERTGADSVLVFP